MFHIYILTAVDLTEEQQTTLTSSYVEAFNLGSVKHVSLLKFPTNDAVYLCYQQTLERTQRLGISQHEELGLMAHYGSHNQEDLQALVIAPLRQTTKIYLNRLKGKHS